eukprot:gb/GEZN01008562.1/.p1 GENE.gb/GEZN01008562.1/~~gb/GEZN01008562.1/.p1  ORF type:complete len:364 (-),score=32.62 gb/GEZN01008562.1/:237-1328(-)
MSLVSNDPNHTRSLSLVSNDPNQQDVYELDAPYEGDQQYNHAANNGHAGNNGYGNGNRHDQYEFADPQSHDVEMLEFEHNEGEEGEYDPHIVQVPLEMEKHRPYFTVGAIIVCVLVFVWEMSESDWKFVPLTQNIMLGPSNTVLLNCGAKQTALIVEGGQWWRLIAPIFLHAGLIHLGLNMVMLWGIAQRLEEAMGFVRVGVVFMLSGIFGYILSAIFLPNTLGVGASGAVFGVLGGLLGDYMHNHQFIVKEEKHKYLASLLFSSFLGLALGLIPQFDNFGHLGGWTCGLAASGAFFSGTIKNPLDGKPHHKMGIVLCCFLTLVFMYIGGLTMLYTVQNAYNMCPDCKYLSCVPTKWWNCDDQ